MPTPHVTHAMTVAHIVSHRKEGGMAARQGMSGAGVRGPPPQRRLPNGGKRQRKQNRGYEDGPADDSCVEPLMPIPTES
jgi:hypothetical protein